LNYIGCPTLILFRLSRKYGINLVEPKHL